MPHKKHDIDAAGAHPGRLASLIATLLIGKHKPSYEFHVDHGDRVVVKNVEKVVFTGKKLAYKEYRHHTMHPGGLKATPAKQLLEQNPAAVIRHAVAKMLPKNKFRAVRLQRLSFK